MNVSVKDVKGALLIVRSSLCMAMCGADCGHHGLTQQRRRRPSRCMIFFVTRARELIERVATGSFRAMMLLELVNDGPVTILLDSRKLFDLLCAFAEPISSPRRGCPSRVHAKAQTNPEDTVKKVTNTLNTAYALISFSCGLQ